MIEGLVSTIIPVYNRAGMLREAVDSVLAQTWRPIEIIVVDDGSTDDTGEVADVLAARHRGVIQVLRQENAGPGAARQAGFNASRGEFIQFLDSDDLLLPGKFALQIRGLRDDPEAGISYGKTYTDHDGRRLPEPAQGTGRRLRTLFPAMLEGPIWPTLAPLYRRPVLLTVGPWPTRKQLEDWEFDAQAGALGVKLHWCGEVYIAVTRNHADQRLCHLWMTDRDAMRDRVAAYVAVLGYAQRVGVHRESPQMQRFARSLFWMARTAGSYGLQDDAEHLFRLAREQSVGSTLEYRFFRFLVAVLGWQRCCRLVNALRGVR